nr:DUF6643 family protein [Streptomyces sp. MNU76]
MPRTTRRAATCPPSRPRCRLSQPAYGYPQAQQPSPLQQAPNAYIPQQAAGPRGYPGAQPPQQQRPMAGYEAMRPAAPRPAPAVPYQQDPYNGQQYRGY